MIGFISETFFFAVALCVVAGVQILLTLKLGLGKMVRRWVTTAATATAVVMKLIGTTAVLFYTSKVYRTKFGRKTSLAFVPKWEWLTILTKDANGKYQAHSLVGYTKAMGGAFATAMKRHDIVFVLKGYYSSETERFVTEHELGHVHHNHVPRIIAAGQFGVMDHPKFEVEADMHAASVVGWSNAYYALTEIQQKICEEFGEAAEEGVRKIATRKVAMVEKWKSSPIPV